MLVFYLAALETQEEKNRFEYIYRKYADFMYKIAFSITHSHDLTEDAVHDTFLQVIHEINILRMDNEKELKSYLYIITYERTIDFLRKWERKRGLTQNIDSDLFLENNCEPEQLALTNITLEMALHHMENMPEMYRRPLMLRVKGYSIKEIARMMQCTESSIKVRIHRARKMILSFFENE